MTTCVNCKQGYVHAEAEGIKGVWGECETCGLYITTVTRFLTLKELNERQEWMHENLMIEEDYEEEYVKKHGTTKYVPYKKLPYKQNKKWNNKALYPYWFKGVWE